MPSAADITSSWRNRQRSLEWPQRVLASEALRHRTMLAWQLRLAVWALRPPQWPESHRARKQAGALSRLHHFRRGLPLENEFAPSRPTSGRLCFCPCLCMRKAFATTKISAGHVRTIVQSLFIDNTCSGTGTLLVRSHQWEAQWPHHHLLPCARLFPEIDTAEPPKIALVTNK